jgi:hypothetical protein
VKVERVHVDRETRPTVWCDTPTSAAIWALSARHHAFVRNKPHGPEVLGATSAGSPTISQRRSLAPRLVPPKTRGFL